MLCIQPSSVRVPEKTWNAQERTGRVEVRASVVRWRPEDYRSSCAPSTFESVCSLLSAPDFEHEKQPRQNPSRTSSSRRPSFPTRTDCLKKDHPKGDALQSTLLCFLKLGNLQGVVLGLGSWFDPDARPFIPRDGDDDMLCFRATRSGRGRPDEARAAGTASKVSSQVVCLHFGRWFGWHDASYRCMQRS